jgi:glycosyltransferase involved in cell wall biosynthesis
MKVAHLIDTLAWGGAQKLLVDFGNAAVPRGVEVLVIVLRKTKGPTPYSLRLEKAGVRVRFLSIATLFDMFAIPQLLEILREERVDILHTHLSHANILGGIAGRLAGIPVVATLHNVRLPSTPNSSVRSIVERIVLRFLTRKLIAVGNIVADTHRAVFRQDKLYTIPNPVYKLTQLSPAERNKLRQEISGDSFQTIVLAIGRLIPRKGYAELLSAFAKVRVRHPDAILVIAGDGDWRETYEEQARSLALNGSVRFLGFREDITSLLWAADLYVNSSHWEGLSVAMLEAMSAGVPVLATSVGDAPYLLAEGRGVLVPPGDIEAFATEFSHLLGNAEALKVLGERGRAYVEENYSVDIWLDALLEVYTSLMGKSS